MMEGRTKTVVWQNTLRTIFSPFIFLDSTNTIETTCINRQAFKAQLDKDGSCAVLMSMYAIQSYLSGVIIYILYQLFQFLYYLKMDENVEFFFTVSAIYYLGQFRFYPYFAVQY